MAEAKRYYWLRFQQDFFKSKRIKKLRKLAGGDTFTIIYLKMQLLSLKDNGILFFDSIEDSFADEIALDIDEDAENVKITVNYLLSTGLLVPVDECSYELPYTKANIGSETASTLRSRACREKKALQCNTDATLLQQNATHVQQSCNVEKEIDIEKDIYIKERAKSTRFVPPSVDEVKAYCQERNNSVDAESFVDFYESKNWMVGKNKMKDWKASIRTWERREKPQKSNAVDWDSL